MQVPLEITFHNMDSSEFIEAKVRERVDKLERFASGHLVRCSVAVEAPHKGHHRQSLYHVRIEMGVPGKDLVVSRDPGATDAHRDVYVAIRDAFSAAERQLAEYARVTRHEVKTHEPPMLQGRITRLFAEHGFIATTDGREIYFHRNAVVDSAFEGLSVDQPVALAIVHSESPAGPQATTVRPIAEMKLQPQG